MRTLTYHVAVSLDGYIADPNGSFEAFAQSGDHIEALVRDVPETLPGHALSALGVEAPNATYDTVVMGWNTFAVGLPHGIDDPYPHLEQYVVSRSHQQNEVGGAVQLVSSNPVELVRRLKAGPSTKGIWLCGGGALAATLRDEIDRLSLKVNPVLLGAGVPLFQPSPGATRPFTLTSSQTFDSGVSMTTYDATSS